MIGRTCRSWNWLHWARYFWNAGWRPLDLDQIPSYSRRQLKRLATLLMSSVGLLACWICAHQIVAPDIGTRSFIWIGGIIIPNTLMVWFSLGRLKPSWREYIVMYAVGVAYMALQHLYSMTQTAAAAYLLAGTCFVFLLLSNIMLRFRFANAVVVSLYITLVAVWLFVRTTSSPNLVLTFDLSAFLLAASTLYVNYVIGSDEMHYMRLEQHFRLVLSSDKRDLWEFDSGVRIFRILPWNAGAAQPPKLYVYDEYLSLIHSDYRPALIKVIDDCLTGRAARFQLEFQMRSFGEPEWRWVQLAGHAGEQGANGAVRLVGTCCDVTDRKSLHARVEEQSRECEQAARAKAEFLATISHSIRTPLNAVIGATAVLATDDLAKEPREMVDTIQRSGHLLLTVLNDILDLNSSVQAGLHLEPVPFDPHQLLEYCRELIAPLAHRKNLEIRVHASPEMSPNLLGDEVRLQQVLINLLSNAVKFTKTGWISLSASLESTSDAAAQMITFAVCDTGVGIEEHAQQSLFERFEQLHTQTISAPEGTGLGLAISQRLVRAMGGAIRCQSKQNQGSAFSFTLRFPIRRKANTISAGVTAAASRPESPLPALSARVLVAEDNPVNQRVLASMLRRLHCDVRLAANGAEAVEACRNLSFDVIFMDCDMPVLNGMDATRHIRQLPQFADVPIIAATAHALPANLDACLQAGMSDTLTKPVTFQRLAAALEQWVTHASAVCEKEPADA